jgi:hypothetical protein
MGLQVADCYIPVGIEDIFDLYFVHGISEDYDDYFLCSVCLACKKYTPKSISGITFLACTHGTHGSAKSTFQEFIKLIVDPSAAPTTVFPSDMKELVQTLSHSYVTFVHNASEIKYLTSNDKCHSRNNIHEQLFFILLFFLKPKRNFIIICTC